MGYLADNSLFTFVQPFICCWNNHNGICGYFWNILSGFELQGSQETGNWIVSYSKRTPFPTYGQTRLLTDRRRTRDS